MAKITTRLYSFLVLIIACVSASAQKLPATQQASIKLPVNLKIDGKATEWKDSYQAYNKPTDIFYTIANDDTRVYLIVHAVDPVTIRKLIAGGLSFDVSKTGDKNDSNMPGFKFPMFEKSAKQFILYKNPGKASDPFPDSTIVLNNKKLVAMSKIIGLNNGTSTDSLSIYNDKGLQAIALFDKTMGFTIEATIDLKLLNIEFKNTDSFFYHIQCNAMELINMNGFNIVATPYGSPKMQVNVDGITKRDMAENITTTDFWGEYKLAKK